MVKEVAIVRGQGKDETKQIMKQVAKIVKACGVVPIVSEEIYDIKRSDMIISLGGDGAILSLARKYAINKIPILGINLGNTGFLTELELEHLNYLPEILKGEFDIDERMMLEVETSCGAKITALNDITIKSSRISRIISANVLVDGVIAYKYMADGIIISSPTGSTAYSRNVGGPIVQPNMDMFVVSPISPTKRNSDILVIQPQSELLINTLGSKSKDMKLIVDGQESINLEVQGNVFVKKSNKKARLVRRKNAVFYDRLIEKL